VYRDGCGMQEEIKKDGSGLSCFVTAILTCEEFCLGSVDDLQGRMSSLPSTSAAR
jgi:hypothetical protein